MDKPDMLFWRPNYNNSCLDNKNIVFLCLELLAICALEGLELIRVKHNIPAEVCKSNCSGDQGEPITRATLELKKSLSRIVHSLEWSDVDSLLCFWRKIYVSQTPDLHRKIVALYHDTKIARHPRRWKVLELMSHNYWWP